jgi:hypothetical protein
MIRTEAEFKPEPTADETARKMAVSDDQDISLPDPVFLVLAMDLMDLLKICVDTSRKVQGDEPLQS